MTSTPALRARRLAAGAALLGTLAMLALPSSAQMALQLTDAELDHLGVEWARAEASGGRVVLNVPATVTVPPARETVVSAPVGGLVTRLLVAEGSEVEVGDPLLELRSLELLAAQREHLDAASAARLAEAQLQRDRTLHGEGIIARRRLDETEAAALAARLYAEQARQQMRLAGADDAELERLTTTGEISAELTVRAPVAGVVVDRHGDVGEQVEALEPIVRIADLRELWLEARVPQQRADAVTVGMQLAVEVRGETVAGPILHVGRTVDAGTQTVLVRAQVDNPGFRLRAGQVLPARIVAPEDGAALAVPMSALTRIDGQPFVFARAATGLRAVPVTVVGEQQRRVQIESRELAVGDQIAGTGVSAIKALLTGDDE